MKGYWHMPTETANALRDGWLHTGDLSRMDADGYFQIVDRKKDMILGAGGFNIYFRAPTPRSSTPRPVRRTWRRGRSESWSSAGPR